MIRTRNARKNRILIRAPQLRMNQTCVPLDTGRKIAPAPATLALALAIDGSLDPKAEAER